MHILYKSSGILKYNPVVRDLACGTWWLILECCPDLARYYRNLFNSYNRARFLIGDSAWGSHISIIRGEYPSLISQWRSRENEEVEFFYTPIIRTDDYGIYYWLDIQCVQLEDIREIYGLPKIPKYDFHLTIGRRMDAN